MQCQLTLRTLAIKCPTRNLLLRLHFSFFESLFPIFPNLHLVQRTVSAQCRRQWDLGVSFASPTIGNLYPLYPRFSGPSSDKVAADGENDPIGAERGPKDLPALCQFGQPPRGGLLPIPAALLAFHRRAALEIRRIAQHDMLRSPVRRRYGHPFVGNMGRSTSCRCFLLGLWAYGLQYK